MYDDILRNWSDTFANVTEVLQLQAELALQSPDFSSALRQESFYNIPAHLDRVIAQDWLGQLSASYDYMSQVKALTPDWIDQLSAIYDSISHVPALTSGWIDQISEVCNSISQTIELSPTSFDNLSFLRNIDFQEEYIDLTDEECDSINTILQSPDAFDDAPPKVSKGRIAVSDFIKTILIPILAILLPLLLTAYYHKVDSIESQKRYIEESQLKKKELQSKEKELQLREEELHIKEQQLQNDIEQKELLENILIEAQSFSEYLESLQEDPECPSAAPEPFVEVPHSPDDTQDND